jgi:hypothetical protein
VRLAADALQADVLRLDQGGFGGCADRFEDQHKCAAVHDRADQFGVPSTVRDQVLGEIVPAKSGF